LQKKRPRFTHKNFPEALSSRGFKEQLSILWKL
jgi:hypothetical protein